MTFKPTLTAPRYGAAALQDSAGSVIASGYVQGIGVGPQVSFSPSVPSIVTSSGLLNPRDLTADGNGNLYVADIDHNRVLKETYSGGAYSESTIASSGLQYPIGIAVDGAGSVYIGNCFNHRIVKETLSGTNYSGIARDASKNIYISDASANTVIKETLKNGAYSANVIPTSSLNHPGKYLLMLWATSSSQT